MIIMISIINISIIYIVREQAIRQVQKVLEVEKQNNLRYIRTEHLNRCLSKTCTSKQKKTKNSIYWEIQNMKWKTTELLRINWMLWLKGNLLKFLLILIESSLPLRPGHTTRKYQTTKMKNENHFRNHLAVCSTLTLTFQILIIRQQSFITKINNEKWFYWDTIMVSYILIQFSTKKPTKLWQERSFSLSIIRKRLLLCERKSDLLLDFLHIQVLWLLFKVFKAFL